ncbi:MAG: NAD+ synthase [Pseudomonadota bacterium]|nr:NAD+ synthase [Pseudomonadota bacterium]
MADSILLALAQINCVVGDITGNADRILELARRAKDEFAAGIIVFPELTLTGYPPEDLLLRDEFIDRCEREVGRLIGDMPEILAVVGHPRRADGHLYNAASVIGPNGILATYDKQMLPNYSVFDEKRYFASGTAPCVFEYQQVAIGLTICEDVWEPEPVARCAGAGAKLVININASPFHVEKQHQREEVVALRARNNGVPVAYVNMVGGQDELVFDGVSFVTDARGVVTQRGPQFEETLTIAEFQRVADRVEPIPGQIMPPPSIEQSVYGALVTGVRDYVNKNGFNGAIIGLSGGIDSALTVAVASDALGPDRVRAVMMPSPYTSDMSLEDAQLEAEALGVQYDEISIAPVIKAFEETLAPFFAGLPRDATEENIQARARGILLMALSNKSGSIVLTTGNKSEMAVGYATLYGDMAGGFAVIKDVPKLLVYRLCEYRNSLGNVIPRRVLERPPSAELRPDQKDEDSLPPYRVLDVIIEMYVEQDRSAQTIVDATGFDADEVMRVIAMVNRNEYKRRQAPPGVRISHRAFGRDRRYPITSAYRQQPPVVITEG